MQLTLVLLEMQLGGVNEFGVIEKSTNIVYKGVDASGVVRYIGITERNASLRFVEHFNSIGSGKEFLRYDIVDGATELTRINARVWEQNLINEYGLQKNGGLLINKVNSIAPKYWWLYGIK